MNGKKVVCSVVAGGIVYLIFSTALSIIAQAIAPFSWADVGGMRAMNDPWMIGYFFYGFVLLIGAAILYQIVNLKGTVAEKGIKFGALMWLVTNIPSAFIILTTMIYPLGFFLQNVLFGYIIWLFVGTTIACMSECRGECCRFKAKKKRK